MTAEMAAPLWRDGEKETKEGNESNVITTLVQILGSDDPKTALLGAINDDTIPDEICLELAEHLGELVEAMNFDNRIEVVFALCESGAISEKTKRYLLLAILETDEQKEISACPVAPLEADGTGAPAEIALSIPEPTLESPAPALQAPPANLTADLIGSATELQRQFGTNLPEGEQSKIRQAVGKLPEEEFASLRQILGSAILAQAEVPADQRQVDVVASLQVVEILLGKRQAELTSAAFAAYEILGNEGSFRLTLRNEYDRPLMVVASMSLLRNRFQKWLDFHESGLGAEELASAQKAVATLEGFLLAAADDFTKTAIQRERATRLRERIISSRLHALDRVSEELVTAQPTTKEEALNLLNSYLRAKRSELASELRTAGSAILGEAETTIRQIFNLHLATSALRREMAELKASDYDPLAQRPMLSDRDKQLTVYELERKELVSIFDELEAALEEGSAADRSRSRNRKKLQILLAITASKLQELDQLIAGLRPAQTLDSVVKLALPVTELEIRHG